MLANSREAHITSCSRTVATHQVSQNFKQKGLIADAAAQMTARILMRCTVIVCGACLIRGRNFKRLCIMSRMMFVAMVVAVVVAMARNAVTNTIIFHFENPQSCD